MRVHLSEEIIPVETLPEVVDLVPELIANGVVGSGRFHVSEIESALVVCIVLDHARRDQVEVVDNIWESGRDIDVPISSTIGNNETFQRKSLGLLVYLDKRVVVVDLPSQVGCVDSTVALARYVKIICKEFWETSVPVKKGRESVL